MIELPVGKNLIDQMLNQTLDPGGRRVFESSRSGLDHIGQHHQRGFAGLRFGTGIAEVVNFYGIFALQLLGLVVKIADQAGAVVLPDVVDNDLGEFFLPGDFNSVLHMGDQYQARHGRR